MNIKTKLKRVLKRNLQEAYRKFEGKKIKEMWRNFERVLKGR